jgi:hypothetical protein
MGDKSDWVRVESEAELSPGMTVEVRNCRYCGRAERHLLVAVIPGDGTYILHPDGTSEASPRGWRHFRRIGGCIYGGPYRNAILSGRLFRLADHHFTNTTESTDTSRPRELADADERGRR